MSEPYVPKAKNSPQEPGSFYTFSPASHAPIKIPEWRPGKGTFPVVTISGARIVVPYNPLHWKDIAGYPNRVYPTKNGARSGATYWKRRFEEFREKGKIPGTWIVFDGTVPTRNRGSSGYVDESEFVVRYFDGDFAYGSFLRYGATEYTCNPIPIELLAFVGKPVPKCMEVEASEISEDAWEAERDMMLDKQGVRRFPGMAPLFAVGENIPFAVEKMIAPPAPKPEEAAEPVLIPGDASENEPKPIAPKPPPPPAIPGLFNKGFTPTRVKSSMVLEHWVITPEQARWILDHCNPRNRNCSIANVHVFAAAMRDGKWNSDNGEPIVFADDPKIPFPGRLVDGQHRLSAIAECGKPVRLAVILHASETAYKTMDTGRKRTASDVLRIEGFTYPVERAGTVKFVLMHNDGQLYNSAAHYSNEDILEAAKKYDVTESVRFVSRLDSHENKIIRVSRNFAAFLHYVERGSNEKKVVKFIRAFYAGLGLEPDTMAHKLRMALRKDYDAPKNLPLATLNAMVVKAWNAEKNGFSLRNVSFRRNEKPPKL